MRLGSHVVSHELDGIPLIGNPINGYTIGLTEKGRDLCEKMLSTDIEETDLSASDHLLLEHLAEGGFMEDIREDPVLDAAYLHVTQRCNLACSGCYSNDEHRNVDDDASSAHVKTAINCLAKAGVKSLILSGGEPFLRSDLEEIVSYASSKANIPSIAIITNGTIADGSVLGGIAPYVDCVSVSFDGTSQDSTPYLRGEQRFSQLVETVRAIQESGMRAHIIPTIHKKNYADINNYIDLANRLGVSMNFSLLSCVSESDVGEDLVLGEVELESIGRAMADLGPGAPCAWGDEPISAELITKRGCEAGRRVVSVAADGEVYPCHMLQKREFSAGNLYYSDFASILVSLRSSPCASGDVDANEDCRACDIKYLCGAGCKARAYFSSKTTRRKDPYCAMVRVFYSEVARKLKVSLDSERR